MLGATGEKLAVEAGRSFKIATTGAIVDKASSFVLGTAMPVSGVRC
jgi:hypothetical protein